MRKFISGLKIWLVHIPKLAGMAIDFLEKLLDTIDEIKLDKNKEKIDEMKGQMSTEDLLAYEKATTNMKWEIAKAFIEEGIEKIEAKETELSTNTNITENAKN